MSERAKILIVDDEPFNVDYLEQELEDFGYSTISATNGQDALEKVATESPDLILLDVMMPLMDGFTVCRILKEDEDTRLIPIVWFYGHLSRSRTCEYGRRHGPGALGCQ
jgi:CheY-like chemotaxis protein